MLLVGGGVNRWLVEWKSEQDVIGTGCQQKRGTSRMLVEGRGKQDVSRVGGANRLLVEGEGQTGC